MLIVEDNLTTQAMCRLTSGEVLAVRVERYHPPDLCDELADRLLTVLDKTGGYQRIYHSSVPAFTETLNEEPAQADYLASSASAMSALRKACDPNVSPIDRLRCELDEIWPGGARLLRIDGRPLVFGMLRVWRKGANALPHLDMLGESAPDLPEARSFSEQLGVNIYLRVPRGNVDGDGAIELWDLGIGDADRERHGVTGTYGYKRDLLGDPVTIVHPNVGDLLLLRSTRLHAVRPTLAGERVTLSGFVGYENTSSPLRLWS